MMLIVYIYRNLSMCHMLLRALVVILILIILGWPGPEYEAFSKQTKDPELQPIESHSRFVYDTPCCDYIGLFGSASGG